jgi:hypothetical protein
MILPPNPKRNLFYYLQVVYHLSRNRDRYADIVWKKLKAYHLGEKFKTGFFEADKMAETKFNLGDNRIVRFFYSIADNKFKCRSRVLETFDPELGTDLFVLATHFNNLMSRGKVIVYPEHQIVDVEFEIALELLILYPQELYLQTVRHFQLTENVYWAFLKLTEEGEEPAIIIADVFRKYGKSSSNNK